MATNQRPGIIAKYAKGVSSFLGMPTMSAMPAMSAISIPSFGSAPQTLFGSAPQSSWFSSASPSGSYSVFSGLGLTKSPGSFVASGGYVLEVLFYLFLYGFVAFFILLLIHYTVHPIFQFTPGSSGLIPMTVSYDYTLYWVGGVQPISPAPDPSVSSDSLNIYPFEKLYSLSVDIYITDLTNRVGLDRLIFYGSSDGTFNTDNLTYSLDPTLSLAENFTKNTLSGVNMICYISEETNDLIVTYFVKSSNGTLLQKNSIPIQNIPLFTTLRITIVYENSMFYVYYNGLQISQTSMINTNPRNAGVKQNFYANRLDSKCGYVQTLMLWNRAISYPEIVGLPMALTGTAKFNVGPTGPTKPPSCGTTASTTPPARV